MLIISCVLSASADNRGTVLQKTEVEKFAGGYYTTTVEAYIPIVGRGVQGATSHCLGQNFSRMFKILYSGPEDETAPADYLASVRASAKKRSEEWAAQGKTYELIDETKQNFAWQNSWGLTTRTIGVMVMVHSDEKGLVLPPRVAPEQVVIIPIIIGRDADRNNAIIERARSLKEQLCEQGVRAILDDGDMHSPGFKYNYWELRGVPLRLELGPKDFENNVVVAQRRDTGARTTFATDAQLAQNLKQAMETMQQEMLARATATRDACQKRCTEWKQLLDALDSRCTALVPHCTSAECEKNIKQRTADAATEIEDTPDDDNGEQAEKLTGAAKSLCIPLQQPELPQGTKCIGCDALAQNWTLFGRSY